MSDSLELRADTARAKFRRTLGRVLIVQLVSMAVLGLIQILYNG